MTKLLYLNVQQKALINLTCGHTTINLSRDLTDKVIVNAAGGTVRYFYL